MFGCFFRHKFTKWSEIRVDTVGLNYQIKTCLRRNLKQVRII
jgi:hypothetical protein